MSHTSEIWQTLPEQLAVCIERLGTAGFYPGFFQMMKTFAQIDQYMVFECSPNNDYVTCRLAHNIERPDLGLKLASLYLDGGYLEDTLLKTLKESVLNQNDSAPCQLLEKRMLPAVYRRRFFSVPELATKFSFVVLDRESQHLFYINFYSKQESSFADEQRTALQQASTLIGSLLLKHFREERKQRGGIHSLSISGLSEREAQICHMMLQGHTAKSIGNQLGLQESTVITYKKRAFKKLKIYRKSELVRFI